MSSIDSQLFDATKTAVEACIGALHEYENRFRAISDGLNPFTAYTDELHLQQRLGGNDNSHSARVVNYSRLFGRSKGFPIIMDRISQCWDVVNCIVSDDRYTHVSEEAAIIHGGANDIESDDESKLDLTADHVFPMIAGIVEGICNRLGNVEFSQFHFTHAFNYFSNTLTMSNATTRVIASLGGVAFSDDTSGPIIPDILSVVKIDNQLRESRLMAMPSRKHIWDEFAVEMFSEERIHELDDLYTAHDPHIAMTLTAEPFITAMKILFTTRAYFRDVMICSHGWRFQWFGEQPEMSVFNPEKRLSMEITSPSFTNPRFMSGFRDYPDYDPFMITSEDDIARLKLLYLQIVLADWNADKKVDRGMAIAARRLARSEFRESPEDSLVDSMIALEALVSDDNRDIGIKLALRVASLLKLDPNFERSTLDIYNDIRHLYDRRSRVVHGSSAGLKDREIGRNVPYTRRWSTNRYVNAASDYVATVMRLLSVNTKFLDPKQIDQVLLLGTGLIESAPQG